jgi:hypothetical protein
VSKTDFLGKELKSGDSVVFTANGLLRKGVIRSLMPNTSPGTVAIEELPANGKVRCTSCCCGPRKMRYIGSADTIKV